MHEVPSPPYINLINTNVTEKGLDYLVTCNNVCSNCIYEYQGLASGYYLSVYTDIVKDGVSYNTTKDKIHIHGRVVPYDKVKTVYFYNDDATFYDSSDSESDENMDYDNWY